MILIHQYEVEAAYPDLIPKIESEIPYARRFVERKLAKNGIKDAVVDVFLGINGGFTYSARLGTFNSEVLDEKARETFSSKDLAFMTL
ncbi:MAG: hypothetical protein KGH55_03355 [Nanoarchaeota archaeon]|nr:hypothetical protein [Nanoarchaeota archaeon]